MSRRSKSIRARRCLAGLTLLLALCGSHRLPAELFGARSQELQDGFLGEMHGAANDDDALGHLIAAGDFNGDGRDDLAISDQESPAGNRMGAVHALYSDAFGVSAEDDTILTDFDPVTLLADREPFDRFGEALAVGDYNGDAFDDLAIGIPGESVEGFASAGAVLVLYGSAAGLGTAASPDAVRLQRGAAGFGGSPAEGDDFGFALASGDFDHDGRDDLALGVPGALAGALDNAGLLIAVYGTPNGLGFLERRFFSQSSSGPDGAMEDEPEAGDRFARALAAGDFNRDLFDDLAIGVPEESVFGVAGAGLVHVLYGFPAPGTRGLRLTGNDSFGEDNVLGGVRELFDGFGFALAAGDLSGDGTDDLAIGAPGEDVGALTDAGAVAVLFGQLGVGLGVSGAELHDQNSLADGESPGEFDNFGYALAIGDFVERNGVGADDLAIGIVQESALSLDGEGDVFFSGGVSVVPGGFGLEPENALFWAPGYRGSIGQPGVGGSYGRALARGDFDGDGHDDLAIGAIGVNGMTDPNDTGIRSGAVYVLYGALFADGFETGAADLWSGMAP